MVRVYGLCESSIAVFLREQADVVVGDLDWLVFEDGVTQREKILDLWGFVSGLVELVIGRCREVEAPTFSSCLSLEHIMPFFVLCGRTAVMSMNRPVSMSIHLASITLRLSSYEGSVYLGLTSNI